MSEAIDDLFRKYSPMVFRTCFRYTRNQEEAEDLTQEAFLKISRHIDGFREQSQLSTWIYRIAINCSLDHLRNKKRRDLLTGQYLDELVCKNLAGNGDAELARVDLERILGQTKPEVRQILFLTLAEGLSHQEAAEVMGKSKSAVSAVVSRFKRGFAIRKWFLFEKKARGMAVKGKNS
jgi:RNA polymerase sigma factor (sigma-70 family)